MTNPVDLAGAGEQDLASYARGVRVLLASDEVDGVLLTGYFGGYSTEQSDLAAPELAAARQMADAVAAQGKPLVVQTIYPDSPPAGCCGPRASPCTATSTARARCWPASSSPRRPASPSELPAPAPAVTDTSYDAARALFADAGVAFPVAVSVTDAAGLEAALARPALGFPVVLKAMGRLHKSDGRRRGRSASPTATRCARRTPTWSRGWPRRPSPSRRWRTSPTGSS